MVTVGPDVVSVPALYLSALGGLIVILLGVASWSLSRGISQMDGKIAKLDAKVDSFQNSFSGLTANTTEALVRVNLTEKEVEALKQHLDDLSRFLSVKGFRRRKQ